MSRGLPVCQQICEKIMCKNNVPQRKIGKDLDISPSTVHNIIKGVKESGESSVRKVQGRKPKLNYCDLRSLKQHCIKNHHSSISDITTWAQDYFGKPLSSTWQSKTTFCTHYKVLAAVEEGTGTWLACLQYPPVANRECVSHFEAVLLPTLRLICRKNGTKLYLKRFITWCL